MLELKVANKQSPIFINWLTILRIVLGLIILWKSISFIYKSAELNAQIAATGISAFTQSSAVLGSVVTYISLLCGLCILAGFLTRIACLVQIPILFVAVFFVNIKDIHYNVWEFILSDVALILLVLFAIKGSGRFSVDEYFKRGAERDKKARPILR